jgi:hypothetical protein
MGVSAIILRAQCESCAAISCILNMSAYSFVLHFHVIFAVPLQAFLPLLSRLIPYIVLLTLLTGDQCVANPAPTHRTTQREQTHFMFQVGFEPTTPVFEWAKPVHALDRGPSVVGPSMSAKLTVEPSTAREATTCAAIR